MVCRVSVWWDGAGMWSAMAAEPDPEEVWGWPTPDGGQIV